MSIEGMLGKKLVVNAKKGFVSDFPVSLDFTVKDPVQWQSRIENTSKARIESIEAERRKERIQVVLDMGALKDYMVRGGLVLQTMKCPECGPHQNARYGKPNKVRILQAHDIGARHL